MIAVAQRRLTLLPLIPLKTRAIRCDRGGRIRDRRRGELSMLQVLRDLFAGKRDEEPVPEGKLTLADVLRRDWFDLWYQPKIEMKTMRLYGAEALVRARHPAKGVLGPGAFLPGASERDMLALTERVIVTALKDWEECAAHGMSVKFAVNVPVSALVGLPIADIVNAEKPRAANWPGLILEVTEDEIIHDIKLANDIATRLRASHCSLALDDFGAGYSSIARMTQLPFSELKIDRAYVTNCHSDRVNGGLCEVFVELAKRFSLKTVAEGIESTHESHKLQALGCDVGQGYLFAKPMPKAQLIGMMRKRLVDTRPHKAVAALAPGFGKG
jgi:EAL domain-containing protein (putative c-di-GMP-specific phosphodiesterase class I)